MKALKLLIAAALVLALCLGLMPGASAEGGEKIPYGELEWDELMERLLSDYGIKPEFVAAGYLNLETGEEHFLNEDEYMLTGSMYKLPLCMYFTEHLASGDIDWSLYESHFSYEEKRDNVLINSSNDDAGFLCDMIGGYTEFRRLTADYMGVDPDEELRNINNYENWYTAREFIHCLELLYREQASSSTSPGSRSPTSTASTRTRSTAAPPVSTTAAWPSPGSPSPWCSLPRGSTTRRSFSPPLPPPCASTPKPAPQRPHPRRSLSRQPRRSPSPRRRLPRQRLYPLRR